MEKITKEQYEQAKAIVDKYNHQLDADFQATMEKIKADLEKYFSENEVCGGKIEKFKLSNKTWLGTSYTHVDIIPIEPDFDEDYWDDKADADIEAIGQKYGVYLSWESGVYPK